MFMKMILNPCNLKNCKNNQNKIKLYNFEIRGKFEKTS